MKKRLAHLGVPRTAEVIEAIKQGKLRQFLPFKDMCRVCKTPLTSEEALQWDLKNMNSWICKPCSNKRGKETKRRIKLDVITHYGGKCSCLGCGESRIEFLTMDHPNGDGAEQDRKLGRRLSGHAFYSWLRVNSYPTGFRVRCWNCNCSRGAYGYCPHEKEQLIVAEVKLRTAR